MTGKVISIDKATDWKKIVDRFGYLDTTLPWADVAEHEFLRKQISEKFAQSDPYKRFNLSGEIYMAEVSARGKQTAIVSMKDVKAALGLPKFMEIATVTLKALKETLPGAEIDGLTEERQTGPRRVTVALRAPEAA